MKALKVSDLRAEILRAAQNDNAASKLRMRPDVTLSGAKGLQNLFQCAEGEEVKV
jgi:hypothetical protein